MTLKRKEVSQQYAPVYLRHLWAEDRFQCFKIDRQAYTDPYRWDEPTWHDVIGTCPGIVAVCGPNVVGFAIYSFTAESVAIVKLAVHPRHHRTGIGTLLAGRIVDKCHDHARAFVEATVPLNAEPHHLRALAFYKALGWKGYRIPERLNVPELIGFVKENKRK